jgi:peptidoglycan/LPS O-acetylase OafA/YrhL
MRGHSRLSYLPALDGVRALAVLAVLCYHGGRSWAAGGFLGVDAFFVLSGFLITSLLLSEWGATGEIDLKAFWTRRARRLLPALFLVLGAVAVYAAVVAAPTELERIRGDGLASLFYVANWRFVVTSQSYFAQFDVPSPLRHFWSLAIEEQFYLVWPLIVVAFLRWRRGAVGALACCTAVGAVASAVAMAAWYVPGQDPSRVYYGTDTRAQALLIGALLGMIWLRHPVVTNAVGRAVLNGAALIALVLLGWCWSTTTDDADWLYRGGFGVTAILVAVVIASAVQPRAGPVGRALSVTPLRVVGKISYGLYLWHWPVYVVLTPARVDLNDGALFAVRIVVTFALATLSYVLVERPIRLGAWRGLRIRIATPAVVTAVLVALLVVTAGAVAQRDVTAADARAPDASPRPVSATAPAPPRIMLVGDSMADSLAPGLARAAATNGFEFWNGSVLGCGLATDVGERLIDGWTNSDLRCIPGWRERWPQHIADWHPDVVVVLVGAQEPYDRRLNGHEYHFDEQDGYDLARGELLDAVDVLGAQGARVVLLTSPYFTKGWGNLPETRSVLNPAWIDRWNGLLREVEASRLGRVTTLDLNTRLCPEGRYTAAVGDVVVRGYDRGHLSDAGADYAAQWLVPQILALRPESSRTGGPSFA